jgi:hypothetical protein
VTGLVDTGAGASAMRHKVYEKLPQAARSQLGRSTTALVSACTTTMQSHGVATLSLSMPRQDKDTWAKPCDITEVEILDRLNYDFIFGMPALEALGFVIDCGLRTLYQRNAVGVLEPVPLAATRRDKDTRSPITALEGRAPADARRPAQRGARGRQKQPVSAVSDLTSPHP